MGTKDMVEDEIARGAAPALASNQTIRELISDEDEEKVTKPVGAYRCGGRCDAEGFVDRHERIPCPKCRVYNVSGVVDLSKFVQIFGREARYVRARTALEAMQVYAKSNPTMVKFSAQRHNHEYGKRSTSIEYVREGEIWKRQLSRPTEERAMEILAGRIYAAMKVAEKTWKVPGGKVAGVVKFQLDAFMKERNLVFKGQK